MKKILFTVLALLSLSSSAYTIKNNTDATFRVTVSYSKWWFDHTYRLHPFETISTMAGLEPNTTVTFKIYNYVFSHYEIQVVDGKEHKHAVYAKREQFISDLTTSNITIHGFENNWVISR